MGQADLSIGVMICGVALLAGGCGARTSSASRYDADDTTTPSDAATPNLPGDVDASGVDDPVSGERVIELFEQALTAYCLCGAKAGEACDDLWDERFGCNKACVAAVLDRVDANDCVARGAVDLRDCHLREDCMNCRSAILTEDTPLAEVFEYYCSSDQTRYSQELREADCW